MSKNINNMDPTVVSESLTRQVATVMLGGASVADCARQLTISPAAVRKIVSSEKYKELIAETAEAELGPALAKAKAQLARLSTKAVAAIEKALDTGGTRDGLHAATIVLKAVGLHEETEKQQDATINIVLPGGTEPITYEVPSEKEES